MKTYKTNEELIKFLKSKNVIINDEQIALEQLENYSYYSIINSYKTIFKDDSNNYKDNVVRHNYA